MWHDINITRSPGRGFAEETLEERIAALHKTNLAVWDISRKPSLVKVREFIREHHLVPTFQTRLESLDDSHECRCILSVCFENDVQAVLFRLWFEKD